MDKNIIIPNKEEFEKKKGLFIETGKENFHIISDFDRTLTKAFKDNGEDNNSFSWINENKYLDPKYVEEANKLYNIYYPIEVSKDINQEEKNSKMQEWWKKHMQLFIDYGLNKHIIEGVIKDNKIGLRDGCKEFIQSLEELNIPLLILSAGLGDMIESFLIKENIMHSKLHIIANFFDFDKDGKIKGYKSKIIHTFNKNESSIKNTPYYNEIKERKNVLLIGDNLGDLSMSEGLDHNAIIKIGFLNKKEEHLLDKFKDNFDVIILKDGTMNFINDLIKEITNS
jgi:5'-nucleotidase|tara:strand:- start:649 stop:1497 length:849 start_codon:yes stop_codon:yes gene_type:complete